MTYAQTRINNSVEESASLNYVKNESLFSFFTFLLSFSRPTSTSGFRVRWESGAVFHRRSQCASAGRYDQVTKKARAL